MSKIEEKIPDGYVTTQRLYYSPMRQDYLAICDTPEPDVVAILRFDGIEEHPISIETYYEKKVAR